MAFSPYATTTCKFSQGAVIAPDENFHCESPKAFYAERGLTFELNSWIFYMGIKLVLPEGTQDFISDFFKGDTKLFDNPKNELANIHPTYKLKCAKNVK